MGSRLANLFALALALVLLAGAELGLRAAGLPRMGRVFLREGAQMRLSPEVALRYFGPRAPLVPEAHSQPFGHPKPQGVVRIVCLGGSTMAGYPFTYNGTLPSLLRDRLAFHFPEKRIEVLNMAISAVGTYAVWDIARHVVEVEPDAIVVYSGHNEFYGAMGVCSSVRAGFRPAMVAHLRLLDSSLYRLMWSTLGRVGRRQGPVRDVTLMARMVGEPCVPSGSPAFRRAVRTFSENLASLCRVCAQRRVPLVVGELVCNLRDQPPFPVCVDDRHDTAAQLFWQARRAEREGNAHLARALYEAAKEQDECRFRAPQELNDSLRAIVARWGHVVVPLQEMFSRATIYPAPGFDLFFDHLHPNLQGYLLMAQGFAEGLREAGAIVRPEAWPDIRSLTLAGHEELAVVTELEQAIAYDKIQRLMGHWPFSPDQSRPIYAFDDSIAALARLYHERRVPWSQIHFMAADYHLRHRRLEAAAREVRAVVKEFEEFWPGWVKLGDVFLAQGRPQDAVGAYQRALTWGGGVHVRAKVGSALLASGRAQEAIPWLAEAHRPGSGLSDLDRARAGYLLGRALASVGRMEDLASLVADLEGTAEGRSFAATLRRDYLTR